MSEDQRCVWTLGDFQGECGGRRSSPDHRPCDNPRCAHDGKRRGYNCHPFTRPTPPTTTPAARAEEGS